MTMDLYQRRPLPSPDDKAALVAPPPPAYLRRRRAVPTVDWAEQYRRQMQEQNAAAEQAMMAQAMQSYVPPPMPSLQRQPQPDEGPSMGSAAGSLIGAGIGRLREMHAPTLGPWGSKSPTGNPFAGLDTRPGPLTGDGKLGGDGNFLKDIGGGLKRLFGFREGGNLSRALKRPGDVAVVGEDEPEIVYRRKDGTLEVVAPPPPDPAALLPPRREFTPREYAAAAPPPAVAPPRQAGMDVEDLFGLVRELDPRNRSGEPPAISVPAPPRRSLSDLQALGIPADAVELSKVPEVGGVDENYTTSGDPSMLVRPRLARPEAELVAPAPPVQYRRTPTFEPRDPAAISVPPPRVRPEDLKASRKLPAPGEEAANDAAFDQRVSLYPETPPAPDAGLYRRERIADRPAFIEKRLGEIEAAPVRTNTNNRLVGALKSAGRSFVEGVARTGSLAGGVGAAAAGGVYGAIDKTYDEQLAERAAAGRMEQELGRLRRREAQGLELQGKRADVRARNASAALSEARPDLLAADAQRKELDARRRSLTSFFNDLEEFDPTTPENAAVVEQMKAVGLPVVAKSRARQLRLVQDARSGVWSVVAADKGTGEATAAPVTTEDGKPLATTTGAVMSAEQQELTRRARSVEGEKNRAARAALSTERLRVQMTNGLGAQAKRTFELKTKGLFEERRQLESQKASWLLKGKQNLIPPAEAERRAAEVQERIDALTGQIEGARGEALGTLTAPAPRAAAPSSARPVTHRMSRALFRKNNPSHAKASDAEVDAILRANGIQGY